MLQIGLNLQIKYRIAAGLFLFLVNIMAAQAVIVENIYESEIVVADQNRQTRETVFEQAFQQTLIRVTGSSQILGNPLIDEARKKAAKYVTQFLYRELPPSSETPADVTGFKKPEGKLLWIKFDDQAINSLLRNSNLPVWGQQRPAVLVWLAVRDGGHRYILRDSDVSPIKDELEKAARLRGLPLRWPSYDDAERARLSFVDLWGGFWDNILAVSRNYQKEAVLVGRYQWVQNQWHVKWDMLQDRHVQGWQIESPDLGLLSSVGIDQTTDQVSVKYALLTTETSGGNFYIDIHGINSVDSYAQITNYLLGLTPVKDVFASEVSELGIRFKIEARGNVEDIKRLIALGDTLQPENIQVTTQLPLQDDVVLAYRIKP